MVMGLGKAAHHMFKTASCSYCLHVLLGTPRSATIRTHSVACIPAEYVVMLIHGLLCLHLRGAACSHVACVVC